jgi:hypothetical protein
VPTVVRAALVLVAAIGVTLALTYPLALHLSDSVPSDLGDPLCYVWMLWWNFRHILTLDFAGYWDAPIFHPFRSAFALDENILGPALIAAPVQAAFPDLVRTYNLLFLFTFLAALTGGIALARHLRRSWAASWLAGLVFAFCAHRYARIPHLDILFGGVAPWTFLFLLRLARRPRVLDAIGLAATYGLIAFASLYHAVFLAVLLAVAGAFLFVSERLWKKPRAIVYALIAAIVVAASMVPVYRAYRHAQELYPRQRELAEVRFYSADLTSYLATSETNRLLGTRTAKWRRGEGVLYPGVTAMILALLFPVLTIRKAMRNGERTSPRSGGRQGGGVVAENEAEDVKSPHPRPLSAPERGGSVGRGVLAAIGWLAFAAGIAALAYVVTGHRFEGDIGPIHLRVDKLWSSLFIALAGLALAIGVPTRTRNAVRALLATETGRASLMMALIAAVAFVLSLGPKIFLNQRGLDFGPYRWLYDTVPTFKGIRVPSRFAAYFMLGLGVLAAGGLDALRARMKNRAAAGLLVVAVFAAWTAENLAVPIRLAKVPEIPLVYDWLAKQPKDGAVLELPVHQSEWNDAVYQYTQTRHGLPLVNGYASFPPEESAALFDLLRHERSITPILEAMLGRMDVTWFVVHMDDRGWIAGAQTPAMFTESPLLTKVADEGGIVVMRWRGR